MANNNLGDIMNIVNELVSAIPAGKKWVSLLTKYVNFTEKPETEHITADQIIRKAWFRTGRNLSKAMSDHGRDARNHASSAKKQ